MMLLLSHDSVIGEIDGTYKYSFRIASRGRATMSEAKREMNSSSVREFCMF